MQKVYIQDTFGYVPTANKLEFRVRLEGIDMSSLFTKRRSIPNISSPFTLSPRRNGRLIDISTFVSPRSSPVLRRRASSRLKILPQKAGNSAEDVVNTYRLFVRRFFSQLYKC